MKVPEPRKLPSGNWFIQLRLNGRSIPITSESYAECKQLAQVEKAKYLAGMSVIKKLPKNMTLSECITKYINVSRATLSPSTVDRYSNYLKHRFVDYINCPLGSINWQKMIDDELSVASEKTVKNAWGLVRPALKHVGYPVPEVRLATVPVKEIPFLQPEEILPFCEAVKGRSYEIAMLLGLHGLRLSEAKALTWDDINLTKKTIQIRGAYVKGENGWVDKSTTKTRTSTRIVPIMIPQLITALESVSDKTGKVVTTHGSSLLRDVKRACERAGVTVISYHGLRHSMASLSFFLGIPIEQIMRWGGWANDQTLRRIYIHLAASAEDEAKNAYGAFFNKKK